MDIDQQFAVRAAPDRVWDLLCDVDVVAACLPGVELKGQDDGVYLGRMKVAFGPTTAVFTGTAAIEYSDADRRVTINARGRDARGATKAAASVIVVAVPDEAAGCTVTVTGDLDVMGPLAQFARTGGVHVTRELLADFAECLAARAASQPGFPESDAVRARSATAHASVGGLRLLWRALRSWLRERFGGRGNTKQRRRE